ncbi:U4/U6 small nuclear ribonucleoprotein Prp31 [Ceratocystis platani]|uniref:U4/U6 small nuclear ribonucleoprotein Prp31 n=1 Tax=Ceratocystis fimbriata f. sp. platani TaxID=88771 RepID=A0A0F8BW42_CERFI|nr:U4/U6 small nuclear ribonucleoprotein Prp31 [Ceratocystis platani]
MATLADELLQDFEDDLASEEEAPNEEGQSKNDGSEPWSLGGGSGLKPISRGLDDMEDDEDDDDEDTNMTDDNSQSVQPAEDEEEAKVKIEKMQLGGVTDVRSVANLMQTLQPVLEKIEKFKSEPQTNMIGNIEDHPEYHLLTQSNGLSTHIDGEIVLVHKFIRDHYSVRFPELETLVTNPLEYAKVVAILGNGPMDADSIKSLQTSTENPLQTTLRQVLDGPTLLVVTMEATKSKGQEMTPEQLNRVLSACELQITLDKAKTTLTEYVQSRMNIFAPNLTVLLGSLTAAQLLNAAGGLTGLSKTPACNIAAWGSKKQGGPGMATNVGVRQQGFLFHSPIIKGIPSDLKRQAMRIVSAKLVLAARADRIHNSPSGSLGESLREACLERLDKLTIPPPNKGQRALPVPDDKPARKRGGRRARKAKEATAMTDLRKAQNRMVFGKEEREVGFGTGDSTVGMGMIGASNDGRIRSLQVDQRTRAKLSQKHKGWGGLASSINSGAASSLRSGYLGGVQLPGNSGLRTSGVGTTVGAGGSGASGLQSSLAFTPVQGLELVDPKIREANKRKREADQDKWFKSGTFTQVGGGSGFKVPELPASKRIDTGAAKMGPPPAKR